MSFSSSLFSESLAAVPPRSSVPAASAVPAVSATVSVALKRWTVASGSSNFTCGARGQAWPPVACPLVAVSLRVAFARPRICVAALKTLRRDGESTESGALVTSLISSTASRIWSLRHAITPARTCGLALSARRRAALSSSPRRWVASSSASRAASRAASASASAALILLWRSLSRSAASLAA